MIDKVIIALLMMFVCTTQGCISDDEPDGILLGVGDELPVFSVTLNNGNEVSTSSLLGKVPVIVFFNTNCGDCRQELPVVQQLWDAYKDHSEVEILLISREESAREIQEYWEANGLTMPYSAQETREIYSLFAPSVIPRIFIADKEGKITASYGDKDMPSLSMLAEDISKNLYITNATL